MKYVVNIISAIDGGNTIGSSEPISYRDFEGQEFTIVSYPYKGGSFVFIDRNKSSRIVICSIDYYSETADKLIIVTTRGIEFKFDKIKE